MATPWAQANAEQEEEEPSGRPPIPQGVHQEGSLGNVLVQTSN